ncbi:MAG: hypothetical protein Q8M54_02795 [Desulfobaccales bacterium]|nr:hypothetical protein [Desulfobaccales bacterium]
MILQDIWDFCEREIFSVPSTDILFNQYKDYDERVDLPNAIEIRKNNLFNYLKSVQRRPEFLVIAEAPGPWGCRFSGIALTSERQLISKLFPFSGMTSSRKDPDPILNIKQSPPYRSTTSDRFWNVMLPFYDNILVWNCVPFHPHYDGMILNPIRIPSPEEVRQFSHILYKLNIILSPKKIISVGKISLNALKKLNVASNYVRHPSRRWFREFKEGILRVFADSNVKQHDGVNHFELTIKTIQKSDEDDMGYKGPDPSIGIALRNAKILLIEQEEVTHIAPSWIGATNRAALIAILMASKHAGINVKKDFFEYVSKLTGKRCSLMQKFLSMLRKTTLVDRDLNWLVETFSGANQLAKLLF